MINDDVKITILTATYNRANLLVRLYNSLVCQSSKGFNWIIVDDGSTDNTKEVIDGFDPSEFSIEYYYKKNGGKHTAINTGIKYIKTPFTFIVDSDDYLMENAIEKIYTWLVEVDDNYEYAGIAGVKVYSDKTIIGEFPNGYDYVDCLNTERKSKGLMGDKAEIYKTELLKNNMFPEFENERFIPETVVWNKFALMGLKVRWYKEPIMVCEYLDNGLSSDANGLCHFKNNIEGYRCDCSMNMKSLKFPYNYSAASVYYAKCIASGLKKNCLEGITDSIIKKMCIKLLGNLRHSLGRY